MPWHSSRAGCSKDHLTMAQLVSKSVHKISFSEEWNVPAWSKYLVLQFDCTKSVIQAGILHSLNGPCNISRKTAFPWQIQITNNLIFQKKASVQRRWPVSPTMFRSNTGSVNSIWHEIEYFVMSVCFVLSSREFSLYLATGIYACPVFSYQGWSFSQFIPTIYADQVTLPASFGDLQRS